MMEINRVSNISQIPSLPLEIQHKLLSLLTTRECWKMSSVCMSWRSMVLNWQPHWKKLPLNEYNLIDPEIIRRYQNYIQSHAVKYLCIKSSNQDKNYLSNLLDFIAEQKYTGISESKVLYIYIFNCSNLLITYYFPIFILYFFLVYLDIKRLLTTDFMKLASCCGNTLTELCVQSYGTDPAKAPADLILRHCPNLEKFAFVGTVHDISTWNPDLTTDFQHTNLSELSIQHVNGTSYYAGFISNFLTPFLRIVPKLKRLHLNMDNLSNSMDDDPSVWLEQLQQTCPELTTLALVAYNPYYSDIFNKISTTMMTTTTPSSSPTEVTTGENQGLKHVLLQGSAAYQPLSKRLLIAIAEKFNQTLELLDLMGTELLDEEGSMSHLSSMVFPLLIRLRIMLRMNESKLQNMKSLETFFERSVPNLKSLSSIDVPFSENTLLSIHSGTKPHLRELEFQTINGITEDQLVAYLDIAGPQLEKLILRLEIMGPRTYDRIFSKCHHLKELTIQTCIQRVLIYLGEVLEGYITKKEQEVGNILQKMDITFRGRPSQYPKKSIINTLLAGINIKATHWRFLSSCPPIQRMPYAKYNATARIQEFTHREYRNYMRQQQK
ncbi:hypothetical protein BDA99DRAFT_527399 [Phascolomyces articulosus]|uniref:F-box domain-containing protein n=1 Tax=Phascolomyces articulosus TaxID=60185 RepID=A0AAD5JMF8_9FUNG|nr:hypothetical protein BDA99DRAFT_527399 [Phascolomyces articulosus]